MILKYYKFIKNFSNNLKNPKNNNEQKSMDYLVINYWLESWKAYSRYEEIKKEYLNKEEINEHEIINQIIFNQENDNLKYSELKDIKIIFPKNEKEIKSFLKEDALALICPNLFTKDFSKFFINYNIYDNKIFLYFENNTIFIESNSNIITKNSNIKSLNNYNDLFYLKQLIKIYFFQKK